MIPRLPGDPTASTLGLAVACAPHLNAQEIQIISSASSAFVESEEGDGETSAAKIGFSFSTPTASFSFGGTPEDPSDPGRLGLFAGDGIDSSRVED